MQKLLGHFEELILQINSQIKKIKGLIWEILKQCHNKYAMFSYTLVSKKLLSIFSVNYKNSLISVIIMNLPSVITDMNTD